MTKNELAKFIHDGGEAGMDLDNLIAELNGELQYALVPGIMKGSPEEDYISDWLYDKLCIFVAGAEDFLRQKWMSEQTPKISGSMRKFVKSEPLTIQQFVIVDAVHALCESNRKLQALKLIRGTFLDDDGGFCSLTDARDICNSIMARK